jgi:hypothetical protein
VWIGGRLRQGKLRHCTPGRTAASRILQINKNAIGRGFELR